MSLPPTYVEGFHDKKSVLQMEYTTLGKTGLKVSKLAFGAAPLGGAATYGEYLEEEAINTVREAIRKGINYIDTAPVYGQGRAEELLGKALAGVPREAYYISSKVSRYERLGSKELVKSEESIFSGFEQTLKNLGLDYVDIVIVHNVEYSPMEVVLNMFIPALAKLIKQNKARHLGLSAYPISPMCEIIEKSAIPIEVIISYSRDVIFDSSLQEYIPFFQSRGIGIINAAITGMGILTLEGPPAWHPATTELIAICKKAAEYAKEKGVELGNLSVGYSLQQPGAQTHLVGMNDRKILQKNLNTLKGLSEEEKNILREIKQIFFNSGQNFHWEEVKGKQEKYRKYLENVKTS
ncbi:uncharacterized protein LOC142319531 [Lycorma delicatula]|uniref:uncharacterized protein LOC142319531 n=1 Tax=Lycorma delicatula TaxID=130591 RepID=UPI003F513F08